MDDEQQLARDLGRLAPSVDEGAARARITRRRTAQRRRRWSVQAAVPVAFVAVVAVAAVQLEGEDNNPSVRTAGDTTNSASDDGDPECEAADRLDRQLGEIDDFAIEYHPSDSPAQLRDMADATVTGTLQEVTYESRDRYPDSPDMLLIFTVQVERVVAGDLEPGDTIKLLVGYDPIHVDAAAIEATFTRGIGAVLFVNQLDDPSEWVTLVEGFWLTCADEPPRFTYGSKPSWTVETVEQLVGAG